jgi:hypothetical protein
MSRWRNVSVEECLGGGGAVASPTAYLEILKAVLREDTNLLSPESWIELWKPQLDEKCKDALNELIRTDREQAAYLRVNIPVEARKNWYFMSLISKEGQEGWMAEDTVLWGDCLVFFGLVILFFFFLAGISRGILVR